MFSPVHILTESDLYTMVAAELFGDGSAQRRDRIGLELELFPMIETGKGLMMLPLDANDGRGLLSWLEELSARNGWAMTCDAYRNPTITLPDGSRITVEPAGQIEYSSSPHESPVD